jgi:hypothetical protein
LLSFAAASLVSQFVIQKYEDQDVQSCKLLVIFCACGTWSLTWRDEHRLRVFDNRALGQIFGPKRDEVTMELRKLHNEESNGLNSAPNIVRVIK